MYDLLIKNANIVTSNNISFGNVAVSNGKIKDVFFDSKTVNAKQILDLNEVDGTLDCISSDHSPGTIEEKK